MTHFAAWATRDDRKNKKKSKGISERGLTKLADTKSNKGCISQYLLGWMDALVITTNSQGNNLAATPWKPAPPCTNRPQNGTLSCRLP